MPTSTPATQLLLPLALPDEFTLEAFHGVGNQLLISAVRAALSVRHGFLYCWGLPGSGRSHLLRGLCAEAQQQGASFCYLDLKQVARASTDYLKNLEQMEVVAMDGIEHLVQNPTWERALFHFYNRMQEYAHLLVVSGNAPVKQLGLILPDLCSRLEWGASYRLEPLSDTDRLEALQYRAKLKGLDLPEEVARFLLYRVQRDMPTLFATLDRLDQASLRAQRKLTIPFIKTVLDL